MLHCPLYAVIDLGSNSFHMLITRLVADSVQVVDKVKRKVRLASGLNEQNRLCDDAIERGLECLEFFAERLQDIPPENIRIVATATLRIATNSEQFIARANKILGTDIRLLSGVQEAEYIYLGVAHTSCGDQKRLVLDIGGASTEIIVGDKFNSQIVNSLNIGCVTYLKRFFFDGKLTDTNFQSAISAAKTEIKGLVDEYKTIGWQSVQGGSGTMQALAEILLFNRKPSIINVDFLASIKQQLIDCKTVNNIEIEGLQVERQPVFASGLAILIALFESFSISELQLSSGAIREGLLYEMLPDMRSLSIRNRTVNSLIEKFHIDEIHSERVANLALSIYKELTNLDSASTEKSSLLTIACRLHEIGLLLEFKRHQRHSAYIIDNADLPGFDQADRQLLSALVLMYKSNIVKSTLEAQSAVRFDVAAKMLASIRISVILCRRRQDDVLPSIRTLLTNNQIILALPSTWLASHPLIRDELSQEQEFVKVLGLSLTITAI